MPDITIHATAVDLKFNGREDKATPVFGKTKKDLIQKVKDLIEMFFDEEIYEIKVSNSLNFILDDHESILEFYKKHLNIKDCSFFIHPSYEVTVSISEDFKVTDIDL